MRKQEIANFIEKALLQERSVVLTGCHGTGKWNFVKQEICGKAKLPGKAFVDASKWKSNDFFEKVKKGGKAYRDCVICIPDIFELDEAFSLINLLFDERIPFLATSDFAIPMDDPEYSSIAGRFLSIAMASPDYRDWRKENPGGDSSFFLNDFPSFEGDETLLGIIRRGLRHGKRVEEQSEKILSLMKYVLSRSGEAFSFRSLGQKLGYSTNTVIDYLEKLECLNLLYSVRRTNFRNGGSSLLFYPTFNSFYQFSKEDLAEQNNVMSLYASKLIGKLLSYDYRVCSGYLYSFRKEGERRHRECGLVISKGEERAYMQIGIGYDEEKANDILSIRDGYPKYFAVLSEQEMQILDNGLRLVGIERLIKGDLGEL